MTWVRLDDDLPNHPKQRAIGKDGRALWLVALCWANKNQTDGYVPSWAVVDLARQAEVANLSETVNCLCAVFAPCTTPAWYVAENGYTIHDYADFQPTSTNGIAIKRSAAGHIGGIEIGEARRSEREANAKQSASQNPSKRQAKNEPVPVPDSVSEPCLHEEHHHRRAASTIANDAFSLLVSRGVDEPMARRLTTLQGEDGERVYSENSILDQIAWLPSRPAKDPVAYLVRAIELNMAMPGAAKAETRRNAQIEAETARTATRAIVGREAQEAKERECAELRQRIATIPEPVQQALLCSALEMANEERGPLKRIATPPPVDDVVNACGGKYFQVRRHLKELVFKWGAPCE